jgi:26S proteasome regulatory subunit N1
MVVSDNKTNSKPTDSKSAKDNSNSNASPKELSEEDKQMVETLNMLVERITESGSNVELKMAALNALKDQIKSSTTSISSIPKALKYLLPHYVVLKSAHSQLAVDSLIALNLAHILSVLAMTFEDEGKKESVKPRESLHYHLASRALNQPIDSWGHEYAKHLAKEIGEDFKETGRLEHLLDTVSQLVPFFLRHNAEPDACDLLVEVNRLGDIVEAVKKEGDAIDYARVCRYLTSCVSFELYPADQQILESVFAIYMDRQDYPWSLVTALRLNSPEHLRKVFAASAGDSVMKRQLAFMLARQRVAISGVGVDGKEEEELQEIMFNSKLSHHYLELAKELQILPPKDPEELFNSATVGSSDPLRIVPKAETAKSNLANVLGNAFLNAGYCKDKYLEEEQEKFLWKNKDVALFTAAASLGAVNMWNLGEGLSKLDTLYNQNQQSTNQQAINVQAGTLLGIGLVHSGIRNEADTAFALLRESLETSTDLTMRTGSILGLSFAYGGTGRKDVASSLLPLISDPELQTSVFASLAVGNIMVGSADGDASSAILQAMMERDAIDLNKPLARFYSLSIALLCHGRPQAAEAVLETLEAIEHHPIGKDTQVLVKGLAYAGSGNINQIHELLGILQQCNLERKKRDDLKRQEEKAKAENRRSDQDSPKEESPIFESLSPVYAVLGMALISVTEEIGQEMALRMFNHVMHYGDSAVRRTVPLAIALLFASHPTLPVMDTLSKFSHDSDKAVAVNAVLAMGVVAGGTNHAKVSQLLRQLTTFHARDPECLLAVRLAQSLVHMGKGTLSLSPIRMQRQLVSPAGLAGLLCGLLGFTATVSVSSTQPSSVDQPQREQPGFILNDHPYMMYFLLAAASPRFLICLDESKVDEAVPVPVRVGQAVDTVGQAGRPRTITGFQTHSTPVVIAYGEQAELATDQYVTKSPILEGFVLVRKVPEIQ